MSLADLVDALDAMSIPMGGEPGKNDGIDEVRVENSGRVGQSLLTPERCAMVRERAVADMRADVDRRLRLRSER